MHILASSLIVIAAGAAALLAHPATSITLQPVGNYRTGVFADGATEIIAFDGFTKRLFSVNGHTGAVDVLSLRNPSRPTLLFSIDLARYGKSANSVAICNGLLAVAVENNDKQAPGRVLLFRTWGKCPLLNNLEIGALPDMITFTPNGRYVLTANEGEPSDDYSNDPEGSVSIIDLRHGPLAATVATASFSSFNDRKEELLAKGVRIYGPNASVAQDFEPEYIAVSHDSRTAWVTLQENNALAVISIRYATVTDIVPLGYKDHLDPYNKFDASDKDDMIYLNTWPVYGMYLPDAIASFHVFGRDYLITANEGDARDYDGYSEESRVKDLKLDPIAFPQWENLQEKQNLGRLKVTTSQGDIDQDGEFEQLYCYGGRSFSILDETGAPVYESGSLLEEITAGYYPDDFNSDNDENDSKDGRSDDKGPEPEGIAIGKVFNNTYAFIGLERIGGIMTFNVSNPAAPSFVDYVNTRDFSGDPETDGAGDLAPEGIIFVPPQQSPNFKPLVIAGYEVSGSITVFEVVPQCRLGHHDHRAYHR
ncbi:MAG: choice-of-anchor I family protein [Chitinispirillaceae bacterium]|nr:choice-of-anchor I family protein [Chitinispirillaceae bacterium]